jgi:hypothetical protein
MDYEKLKQVIQQANPEIMELKFGCEVKLIVRGDSGFIIEKLPSEAKQAYIYWNWGSSEARVLFEDDFKILGRSIRLADVLLAIPDRAGEQISCNQNAVFMKGKECLWVKWNLKDDDLDHQSEDTKKFLIDLLVR